MAAREAFTYHSYLSFSTHNGTAVNEVARIIGNGNFGLGTATPTSKLHLRSGTDSATTLFHLDTGTHGGTAFAVSGTVNNE